MMNAYLSANDEVMKFFAVVLLVFVMGFSILAIVRPDITWWFETAFRSWQYKEDPEPSDDALFMQRVGGVVGVLGCLFLLYLIFFKN